MQLIASIGATSESDPGDLAPEIWIEIVSRLEPPDIASLQMTCHALHDILQDRTVWTAVLLSMCLKRRIYPPSYSMESMTLSQLQNAALAPYTFARRVEHQSTSLGVERSMEPLTPFSSVSVLPETIPFERLSEERINFLVPGGRYLLILTDVDMTLALWDLGPPGRQALERPLLVADVDTTRPYQHGISTFGPTGLEACMNTQGGSVLTIATMTGREELVTVQVFTVDPTASRPQFAKVDELVIQGPKRLAGFAVREDLVLISLCENNALTSEIRHPCVIWNYAEGWYTLGPGVGSYGVHGFQVRLLKDVLITFDADDICVWDIARFSTRTRTTEYVTLTSTSSSSGEPVYRFSARGTLVQARDSIVSSNWYMDEFPLLFDLQDRNNSEFGGTLQRYQLDIMPQISGGSRVLSRCIATYKYPPDYAFVPILYHCVALSVDPRISFGTVVYFRNCRPPSKCEDTDQSRVNTRWAIYTLPSCDAQMESSSSMYHRGSAEDSKDPPADGAVKVTRFPFKTHPYALDVLVGFCPWTGRIVYEGPFGLLAHQQPRHCTIVDFLQI